MIDFKTALAKFLTGEIELPALEAALAAELTARPEAASDINTMIEQLYRSNRLPHQIYAVLKRQVTAGPEAPAATDRTQFRNPDQQARQLEEDDGKTRFRPPPNRDPRTGPSQGPDSPGTTPSHWQQSQSRPQQTSGPPSSGRPSPTGTSGSSSWGSPSQWTERGGPGDGAVPAVGSLIKDRFVLKELLGTGGMGVVYKALDLRQEEAQERNPYVALKLLNEDFKRHPESLKALQRESRKAQDLAHPNIVSVYQFDRDGGNVFMVMELLDGEPLDKLIKRNDNKGLPFAKALEIVESLAAGLAYAHKKDIVHSDFKPSNAWLTRQGQAKIFDFGIARASKVRGDGEKTLFDAGTLGALTPAYASLEMLEGQEPDARDDIYALACVTYELLTGKHPFDKRSAKEARSAKLVPAPVKGLSGRQFKGLLRGLAFERANRSPTVESFLKGIRPRRIEKSEVATGVLLTLIVAVAVAVVLLWYLPKREVDHLVDVITAGEDAAIAGSIGDIDALDKAQREALFAPTEVKSRFIEYYTRQINKAVDASKDRYEFREAAQLLADLQGFEEIASDGRVQDIRDDKVKLFDAELNRAIGRESLIPAQGPRNAVDIVEAIRKIRPESPGLASLLPEFGKAARSAADRRELKLAEDLVADGLKIAPDDVSLINLRDELRGQAEKQGREIRLAQAQKSLSGVLPDLNSLDAFTPAQAPMQALVDLDPQNATLQAAQERLKTLVGSEVRTLISANDFDGATAVIGRFDQLLPAGFAQAESAVVADARNEFDDRFRSLVAGFRKAVDEGRLEPPAAGNAEDALAALIKAGAPEVAVQEARRTIAEAYLLKATTSRNASEWEPARRLVNRGLQQQPDPALQARLNDELKAIDTDERNAGTQGEARRQQLAREAREKAVRSLNATFDETLRKEKFSIADANLLKDLLQQAQANGGDIPDARNRIVERLAARADALAGSDGYDSAVQFTKLGIALFPETPVLQNKLSALNRQRDVQEADVKGRQIRESKERLVQLLQKPAFGDARWDSAVRAEQQQLEKILGKGNAEVLGSAQRIGAVYLEEARAQRSKVRLVKAETALGLAKSYAPQLAGLQEESTAIEQAKLAQEDVDKQAGREAQVNRLKESLRVKAAARAPADATGLLNDLKKLLPPGDPFVAKEGPRLIADAYVALGREALEGQRPDSAEQLVGKALNQVAGYPPALKLRDEIASKKPGMTATAQQTDGGQRKPPPVVPDEPSRVQPPAPADGQAVSKPPPPADGQVTTPAGETQVATATSVKLPASDPCAASGLAGAGARRGCRDPLTADPKGPKGPSMVVIPSGGPLSKPLAISASEITVGDYNAYCQLSGECQALAGKPTNPATGISIQDAEKMASWLSQKTVYQYSIPTAAQWEYAANAEGGESFKNANCSVGAGKGQFMNEAKNGEPNKWGLFNVVGNAREWVKDGGSVSARGGAHTDTKCDIKVSVAHSGKPDDVTGFRLVREIRG